jgi:hypothetical protein
MRRKLPSRSLSITRIWQIATRTEALGLVWATPEEISATNARVVPRARVITKSVSFNYRLKRMFKVAFRFEARILAKHIGCVVVEVSQF